MANGTAGRGRTAQAIGHLLLVAGAGVGLLALLWALDFAFAGGAGPGPRWAHGAGLAAATSSLAETLAAVLGLSLTVVAIVVQLASQRYSPKVADLFLADHVSLAVFGLLSVSCIYAVLLPATFGPQGPPPLAAAFGLLLAVVDFALLLPYFRYVFAFLDPTHIISRIEEQAVRALERAPRAGPDGVTSAQLAVADAVERIADNCIAAIGQSDRGLALHGVRTLEQLALSYQERKPGLPAAWSRPPRATLASLGDDLFAQVEASGLWVEGKVLLELDHVLRRALGPMDELTSPIAAAAGAVGARAAAAGDEPCLELVVRFFNTYLRRGLNAHNVRAAYAILLPYRELARSLLAPRPRLAAEVATHLVYYGRLANSMDLDFVTVVAAHDVRALCEHAAATASPALPEMVERLLSLDQPAEGESEERALIGVRKAQAMLAATLLARGEELLAGRIARDMRGEPAHRLARIRAEILAVEEPEFWEVSDRFRNVDWLEPALRPWLERFLDGLAGGDR